jgi:hypothetical protein
MNTEELNMKHTTECIIEALRAGAWAAEIKLMDIAADRLCELQFLVERKEIHSKDWEDQAREARKERDEARDQRGQVLALNDKLVSQRDEARAEVERLKAELHDTIDSYKLNNLQSKIICPEPSRLEIAAMLLAHGWADRFGVQDAKLTGWALVAADALIAAAKEGK